MQASDSDVFVRCGNQLFVAEKIVAISESMRGLLSPASIVSFTEKQGEDPTQVFFRAFLLAPLQEAFLLAKKEVAERGKDPSAPKDNVIFEVMPFFEEKDGKPILEGRDVEKFRSDPDPFILFKKPLGFRVVKRPLAAYEP